MKVFFGDFGSELGTKTYVVQSGDSLSSISKKFYGDYSHVQEIADANGIDNPDIVYAGKVIELPGLVDDTVYQGEPATNSTATSPVLVPLPATEIPYTQPISYPAEEPIPYTQAISLPADTGSSSTPSTSSTAAASSGGFSIWDYLPSASSSKIFGIDKTKFVVAALGVAGLALLLAAKKKYAANPKRR